MLWSKSMRHALSGLVAVGVVATGCGLSVKHVALARPATDAPKAWDPIIACAKEQGLSYVDARTDTSDPRVRVYIDKNDQLNVVFRTENGHMDMELQIWGKTTDEDRPKILAKEQEIGDRVWACADQKINGAATGTTTEAAASVSASVSATPPP
jgi:hypothetical protein